MQRGGTHTGVFPHAGQDYFLFRDTLPMRKVRLVGLVVARDELKHQKGKLTIDRVRFTVDDSTGACIEAITKPRFLHTRPPTHENPPPPPLMRDIDVGIVLDIKGTLATRCGENYVIIESATPLRCTQEEVAL